MRGLASLAAQPEQRIFNDGGIPWFSGQATSQNITEWTAFNLSAVWACETLIADAIATLPVDTFRVQGTTRKPTTPPVWLAQPNPENNRIDYETQRILSLLGWGNAYSYLLREGGSSDPLAPVLERWLLNPSAVLARRTVAYDERSEVVYWVRGVPIPAANIQHIRGYVLPGYFLGMSVIQNARQGLSMTFSAEEAGARLYEQGMMQSGVLSVPQMPAEISKDVTQRLAEGVAEHNAGSRNAGKPLILVGGTTWTNSMITPQDAQYLETRKFQINEICRWFRVSPHKIQDIVAHASQGGGMGIEQQATEFAQDTLLSWIQRLEVADSLLLPRNRVRILAGNPELMEYVKYNLNAYVRADLATRYAAYQQARYGGWMSANEIRALEDEPPIPNGDIFLQPVNMAEAGTQPTGPPVTMPQPEPSGPPNVPTPAMNGSSNGSQ